jgi:hypothetical protein
MPFALLSPGDDRWPAFLREVPHDFYHLPGYVDLMARQEESQAEAVLVTAGANYFFLPYLVRRLAGVVGGVEADRLGDICSPYGYPGPLVRECTPGFLRSALGRWVAAMREREIASGFFRVHPLLPLPADELGAFGSLTCRGTTVSIELTRSDDAIWDGFRRSHQVNIKQARRRGLVVTMDRGADLLDEFRAIYRETMDRIGAAASYYFPASYYQELSEVLGERLWVGTVRQPGGEAVAAGLFVACGPIVQYHLSGSRTAAQPLNPNKLLLDHAWRWAKARGCQVLHLGGGVGSAEDSLFHFKAGFADRRHPFQTWEVVFLNDVYEALTARRQAADPTPIRLGFFPAYRA